MELALVARGDGGPGTTPCGAFTSQGCTHGASPPLPPSPYSRLQTPRPTFTGPAAVRLRCQEESDF